MTRVRLDENSIGLIIGQDIYDSSGMRLLARGTVITKKSLQVMRIRGIEDVIIENNDQGEAAEEDRIKGKTGTPDFFQTWDGEDELDPILRKLADRQYSKSHYDIFLPVKDEEKPSDFHLDLLPLDEIAKNQTLFTLPEAYYHVSRTINDPTSSAKAIGEAISRDLAFTTRILQLANSSLYPSQGKIASIDQAVTIIGIEQLEMLAIGIAFTRSFQSPILETSSMQNFWKHSIATGIAAKYLAEQFGHSDTEKFFIGGLLHDIGKILEYSSIRDSAYILHSMSCMTGKEQQDLEQEIFGYTHGTLGAMLTENFGLPELLADMIRHHHQPMEAEFREETTIIHLADILSNCFKVGTSGQYYIPRLRIAAPGLLEGGESLIEDTRTTMNSYTSELMGILLIE